MFFGFIVPYYHSYFVYILSKSSTIPIHNRLVQFYLFLFILKGSPMGYDLDYPGHHSPWRTHPEYPKDIVFVRSDNRVLIALFSRSDSVFLFSGFVPTRMALFLFVLLLEETVWGLGGSISGEGDGVSSFLGCGLDFVANVTSDCAVLATIIVDTALDKGCFSLGTLLGCRAPRGNTVFLSQRHQNMISMR